MSLTKKRKKVIRRKQRPDERREVHPLNGEAAGLSGLQQNFGNRAVQRMLKVEQQRAEPKPAQAAVQRQAEEETIPKDVTVEPENIPEEIQRELSGPEWVERYPASDKLVDLDTAFGNQVSRFINALEKAGANVEILATSWPPERAYLMHFAWLIANEELDPRQVPPLEEIEFDTDVSSDLAFDWWHGTLDASQKAAEEMLKTLGIAEVEQTPPLASKHVTGEAIDMRITWGGPTLLIADPLGEEIEIIGGPRDETHPELMALGAAYGVIHYGEPDDDAVHWSVDGS